MGKGRQRHRSELTSRSVGRVRQDKRQRLPRNALSRALSDPNFDVAEAILWETDNWYSLDRRSATYQWEESESIADRPSADSES